MYAGGAGGMAVTDDPTRKLTTEVQGSGDGGYTDVLTSVVSLLESARQASARAVNAVITATYWQVGRRIVEYEQGGADKATYGERLLAQLSADLSSRFGRGFSRQNLQNMRLFYLSRSDGEICQTLSGESSKLRPAQGESSSAVSGESSRTMVAPGPTALFPLPWSHYVRLLSVKDEHARRFYETEALRNGWTIRQLSRQISTQFYERTALSRNKASLLRKGAVRKPEDGVTAEEEIKDPLVLEFLGLKDEYSETDLEEALVHRLEDFLLELGGDFTFIGRQRRLRIGNQWFRVDLLFFHRRLRCLIVIDLKTGRFGHADVGQMHLYLNYAREHWALPDENPPVGLILCAEKDEAVAHYALGNLPNKLLAAEYKTVLPDANLIAAEIERTRRLLETRRLSRAPAPRPVKPAADDSNRGEE
jgi:predicted nuclease of restriction endonuclease-like (RecB) superfamily